MKAFKKFNEKLGFDEFGGDMAQNWLKEQGLGFVLEADEGSVGPAHLVILDLCGNFILVDQHV